MKEIKMLNKQRLRKVRDEYSRIKIYLQLAQTHIEIGSLKKAKKVVDNTLVKISVADLNKKKERSLLG